MKKIESTTNPLYRSWKKLLTNAGIKEERSVIISGRKLVPEFLKASGLRLKYLIVSDPSEVEKLSFHKTLDVVWLKKDLFDEIDEAGTHFPMLIVEAPQLPTHDLQTPAQGLEVVLALSNPQNLGAALRSCEAFEAAHVILLKECANPFLPKVLRSSSGSSLKIRLSTGPSIQDLTNDDTKKMWALDAHGENMMRLKWTKDVRLFIGEEGKGIPRERVFEKQISIPIRDEMDSLNAVAATSIALYSYRQQNG
ncbi:MAG: RNA methyltransferase [Bdellovibrionales bacterium]